MTCVRELRLHMSNPAHALLIGRTLGQKYTIEALVGTGGMGCVYRARQVVLDKVVAIKVLHRELADEPRFIARFEREALSASRLDHPNSLRVLDFGSDDGLLYIVMEYVAADDLLTLMNREWPLSDERIACILSQVLAALGVAHDLGIVHRDLKPENILVVSGTDDDGLPADVVKVCDFGVAKIEPRAEVTSTSFVRRLTVEGLAIGTPDYMSPEQARGESVDGRSDLYSIGVVLYHLLAGRAPFVADSPLGVALQHVSDDPVPPSRHRDVHPSLEAVCLRALAKRPEDRFQSAREMRRALRGAIDETPATSPSAPPLVLTRPVILTPRFGSSSPNDIGASRKVTKARRFRARIRQALAASAGGALVALGISAAVPSVRHTIQQRFAARFELVRAPQTLVEVPREAQVSEVQAPRNVDVVPGIEVLQSTIEPRDDGGTRSDAVSQVGR